MDHFRNHPLYRKHNIDSVMSSLWLFYKQRFFVLFITSFIMSLGIQYLSSTFNFADLQTAATPAEIFNKLSGLIWPMIYISLISLFFTVIFHYYIIYSPVESETTIFNSAYKSLRYLIPYLIIMVLLAFFGSFALLIGLFVIIIGIFFALLYLVTLYLFILPTLMVEGPNIGNAIGRSFKLTHRGFWSNMGWVAVFLLILLVVSLILSSLILIPFTGSFLKAIANPEEATSVLGFTSNPIYIILSSLVNALYFPVMPILGVILYFNGRAREEDKLISASANEDQKIRVEDLYSEPRDENRPDQN